MRKLWITGCIVMICMGMLTACGGNKTEVVPIGDTEEADREVPYALIRSVTAVFFVSFSLCTSFNIKSFIFCTIVQSPPRKTDLSP